MTDIVNDSELDVLRREKDRLQKELVLSMERHRRDVATIGSALIDEANERGWCSQYDDFVDTVNGDLHNKLPVRNKPYVITQTYRVVRVLHVEESSADNAADHADTMSRADDIERDGWRVEDIELLEQTTEEND